MRRQLVNIWLGWSIAHSWWAVGCGLDVPLHEREYVISNNKAPLKPAHCLETTTNSAFNPQSGFLWTTLKKGCSNKSQFPGTRSGYYHCKKPFDPVFIIAKKSKKPGVNESMARFFARAQLLYFFGANDEESKQRIKSRNPFEPFALSTFACASVRVVRSE